MSSLTDYHPEEIQCLELLNFLTIAMIWNEKKAIISELCCGNNIRALTWDQRIKNIQRCTLATPHPPNCAGPCGSGEWQVWCLLWNSLWHLPPQGTLNHQPTGEAPTGRARALRFLSWVTSDTPSLCLVALKRQWRGFLPSQAAGCNWCGRDVSTNLLLSDGLSVSPSSTRLWDLLYQPLQTAT